MALPTDVEAVVETVASAFLSDPLWGPLFANGERPVELASTFWRLFVSSAQRYPCTVITKNNESAAVWFPPSGVELTEEESNRLEEFLVDLLGRERADTVLEISEKFEAARPVEPHFYLSLLATHPDHRGRGLGMDLLRENLSRIDLLGAPAYLESSNPWNNSRYESVGFGQVDEIVMSSGSVVTTMLRAAR